jgi:molybdopterin converting factor small subunit
MPRMRITVLLFASWSDAFGPERSVELPDGARVKDLLHALEAQTAGVLLPRPLVAVNQRYADLDTMIRPTDEVAIIPPVAGG